MNNFFSAIKNDKFLVFIPFLTITTRLIIFLFIPHTYEDAFITFRYAENFADGFGLVYNEGEKVYGTTTPLFAIFLAAFKFIGISCIVSSLAINLLAEGITSIIVYIFLKEYSQNTIAAIISLLYVFSPSNISWSIQGMETAFFGGVIALSFFYLYKKKYFLALLFSFLPAIIRIDGLSITFVIILFSFIEIKSSLFKILPIPLILFISWLIFLYIYYGNFLPNSMMAKLILYSGHQESIIPNLNLVLSKFFSAGFYSSSIMTALFIGGFLLIFYQKLRLYPMLFWFCIYYLGLILSKTSIHGWYLIPPLFVYITISGISIIFLFNLFQKLLNKNKILIQTVIFIGVIFFSSLTLYLKIIQIDEEFDYEQSVRKRAGKFLNENTPENSAVFLEPIGVIGYFSDRYIYDDAALISPIFLEFNKLPYNAESVYKKIQFVKPDYIVLRDKYLDEFYSKTNLLNEYKSIKNFHYQAKEESSGFDDLTIFEKIN